MKYFTFSLPKKTFSPAAKKSALFTATPLPTGQEIYDRLMAMIEPELMLGNVKKLDIAYPKETMSQRKKRYARYAKAFREYRTQYKVWLTGLKAAVSAYKRAVVKASERISKTKENSAIAELEALIKAA